MQSFNKVNSPLPYCLLVFCLYHVHPLYAQQNTEQILTGAIIYNDLGKQSEHPVAHAFDGNENTYYTNGSQFGGWIGRDLGAKHIITRVAYCPRLDMASPDYPNRLQLGIFEGANQRDFGDAVPLFIISQAADRQLNIKDIQCTRGFRYVRFVFPDPQIADYKNNYISELKFYGYAGEGDDSYLPQLTNLPVISIHTVNNQDITSKEVYVKGIVSLIYANGTKIHTDSVEIRGRGNYSWTTPKKPYRIKLATSTHFMDLPAKARNWTLINNYGDKTLMRNILAFDFSRRMEMPYTSPAEAVDVVLNGDYKGCYQLCDHIDVRKNRVDIEEMTISDLTGGYMIEIDAYAYQNNEPKKFTSNYYSLPVTIKYPDDEDITVAQEQYIADYFNKLTDAVNGSRYQDPNIGFRNYMDEETFIRYFLIGEYTGNTDTFWSVKMWKKRDENKFVFSPVWDFDLGFDNDNRTYPIVSRWGNQWLSLANGSSAAGNAKSFVNKILSDSKLQTRMKEIYAHYRNIGSINEDSLLSVVDSLADHLNQSQQLNFKRWQIMNSYVHQNPVVRGSFDAEVAAVKNYISQRITWLDNKLLYVPSADPTSPNAFGGVNVFAEKNRLHIANLPTNSVCRIVTLQSSVVAENKKLPEWSVSLPCGMYFIILEDAQQQTSTKKCIVP